MAADSAAIAAVDVNCLRETVRVESSRMRESSMGTGSHTAAGSHADLDTAPASRQFHGGAAGIHVTVNDA
jgi:hypothetical protein